MRDSLFIALTATMLGVLLTRYLRKQDHQKEASPAAKQSPGVAAVNSSGSPDSVMNSTYWTAFGQAYNVGQSAASNQITENAFTGYGALGRSPVAQ